MSAEEIKRGPLESGSMVIGDEVAAVVVFEVPEMVGNLGVGIAASVRSRYGMPPSVMVAALRQLAGDIEQKYETGGCVCGGDHG
ncbi:hypothetical protein HYQ03_gp53 [Arthrobacter phage Kuleana]|uniref:Uncharacterized protein n=1 Tax=Arthrobacter phage Kuleana TaxID=2653270 RepID=A0A5Q2WE62_9CAUD|nr:hypothetical protein HYQ03_gp53 [Arthrobacter phage Kuleana]QGH74540.1 hypothetical protein SEA_KULEANA_53 [Arthrobacter phage Kuleana]